MERAKKQDDIKEDIKHVLEELWESPPEDMPYKIFARESHLGVDDVPVLSKEDLHDLLHRTKDSDTEHLTSVDAGRIRMLLRYKRHLL